MTSANHSSKNSKPAPRSALPILIPLMSIGLVGLLATWYFSPPALPSAGPAIVDNVKGMMNTPFISVGIKNPVIMKANEANLSDDAVVIGIETAGQFRAYQLDAFLYVNTHVVNDVIGQTPMSVTYCDRTDCIRVFTDSAGDKPLPIDVGGYKEKMFLKVRNDFFFQDDGTSISDNVAGKMPYATHEYTRTTWKAWKTAHPSTEVYPGGIKKS